MTSFITRAIMLLLGYAYPAFECFKTVEKNKPEIEQLIFWCQYWIIIAALTVFERFADSFVAWLPMYSEAKLAFIVYLWHQKTMGATYVYDAFVRPFVAKHELEIDRNISELKTRAGDVVIQYGRKSTVFVQTRVIELLQYVASQSSRVQTVQPLHQPPQVAQIPNRRRTVPAPPPPAQLQALQPIPPSATAEPAKQATKAAAIKQEKEKEKEKEKANPIPVESSSSSSSSSSEKTEDMETDPTEVRQLPSEHNMEQVIRMTRNRLKQTGKQQQQI